MRDGHRRRPPAQWTDSGQRRDLRTRLLENLIDGLTDLLVGQIENRATPATTILHTSILASGRRREPSSFGWSGSGEKLSANSGGKRATRHDLTHFMI